MSNLSVGLGNALKYWAKRLRLVAEFTPTNVEAQGRGKGVEKLEVRREPFHARVLDVGSAEAGVEEVVQLVFESIGCWFAVATDANANLGRANPSILSCQPQALLTSEHAPFVRLFH